MSSAVPSAITAGDRARCSQVRIGLSPTLAARDRGVDGPVAAVDAPRGDLRRRPEPDGRVRRAGRRPRRGAPPAAGGRAAGPPAPRAGAPPAAARRRAPPAPAPAAAPQAPQRSTRRSGRRRPALHRPPGQPRLPGRRPALGAAHLLRDQRPQPGDRPLDPGHRWTCRCATCRGIRRSTSSCAPTASATSVDGTIVRVAPLTVLADEEGQRRKLQDEQALAGELRVMSRSLSYARAEDLKALLTATALSQRGSIQTDARTNTIIINDLRRAPRARRQPASPRSTCRSRRSRSKRASSRPAGRSRPASACKWGIGGRATPALGNTLPLAFPNSGGGRRRRRPRRPGGALHGVARARVDQRRVEPRRGAVGARTQRARAASCPRRASRRRTTSRPRSRRASRFRSRPSPTTPSRCRSATRR